MCRARDKLSRRAAHPPPRKPRHRPHRRRRGRGASGLRRQGARRERPRRRRFAHRRGGRTGEASSGSSCATTGRACPPRTRGSPRAPRDVEDRDRRGPAQGRDVRLPRGGAALDRFGLDADADDLGRDVTRGDPAEDRVRRTGLRGGRRRGRAGPTCWWKTLFAKTPARRKFLGFARSRGARGGGGGHEGRALQPHGRLFAALERPRDARRARRRSTAGRGSSRSSGARPSGSSSRSTRGRGRCACPATRRAAR